MCGISGVISSSAVTEVEVLATAELNRRLAHRGPDSEGTFVGEHSILAMRRLSIVDVAGGQQPIFNETRDIVVVCNGEIYNHSELRAELRELGHRFASLSDVEVVVHSYEEYGIECFSKFRGMFALAIWDKRSNTLLLARDRMGEKPLYLHRDHAGRVWFSSEMRGLVTVLPKPAKLSPEAFNLFLTFQYVPEPFSLLEGVEVLPAGHYLELRPGEIDAKPQMYWDLADRFEETRDPVLVTEEALGHACKLMGSAEVPVAIALSGGIDSSLVAAITARHFPGKLHAFTVGYKGRPATDERTFAASLADKLDIGFTEVELDSTDVVNGFPLLTAAMDTPIGDIAAFGYYSVAKAAKQAGYPVLLSGTGGDEFFWGYEWVRDAVSREEASNNGKSKSSWWRRMFGKRSRSSHDFYGVHHYVRQGDKWSRMLAPANIRQRLAKGLWREVTRLAPDQPINLAVSNVLNRTWLRSNCLALLDQMTMAHSVEGRLPLLDVELIERVTGMRNAGLKDWQKPHKWLLTEALKDVLPQDILARRKQGFTPPVKEWMKSIVERYLPLVFDGALVKHGLVEQSSLRRGLKTFDVYFLYKLVVLECWVRLNLEHQNVADLSLSSRQELPAVEAA